MKHQGFEWDAIDEHNARVNRQVNWLMIAGFSAIVLAVIMFCMARAEAGERVPTSCLPASIKMALAQANAACGIKVISTMRAGAIIAGTDHKSLHASCHAADFTSKNYDCVYRTLSGWWPGKLSVDANRMGHVHIDDGSFARFVHGGRNVRLARLR